MNTYDEGRGPSRRPPHTLVRPRTQGQTERERYLAALDRITLATLAPESLIDGERP